MGEKRRKKKSFDTYILFNILDSSVIFSKNIRSFDLFGIQIPNIDFVRIRFQKW